MFNYFVDYCLTKLYCAFYLYIYIPKHNRKFPETEAKIDTLKHIYLSAAHRSRLVMDITTYLLSLVTGRVSLV